MSERAVITERLQKKISEIQALEEKLRVARIYAQALQDILGVLDVGNEGNTDSVLRSGSSVASAREAILNARRPLHINELLRAVGRGTSKDARSSLTSSLSAYVRRGEIFTRPAPNTFGLVELHGQDNPSLLSEPPEDFGREPGNDRKNDYPSAF